MKTIQQTIRLHPAQAAFCRSEAPIRGFLGGRGAGKSHVGALDLIRRAQRSCLYLVAAPTYTMLSDATMRTFLALARELGVLAPGAARTSPPASLQLSTGAEVVFRSTDSPDRLRGPSYSGCWLDEAAQMDEDAFNLILPALRQGGQRGWLTITTTPRGLSHWTYDVLGRARVDVETFFAPSRANPFLPPSFEHDIREQYGDAGLLAEQELEGRFVDVLGAEWPADYFGDHIWFVDWPDPATIVRSVLAIDGSKGKLDGDLQALVLLRLDAQGRFWIDAEAHHLDEERLLAKALDLIGAWQPTLTVVETNGAGYYLLGQIARAQVRGLRPPVVGRQHGSAVSKEQRINARLTGQWARGTIRLRKGSPGTRLLAAEARDFPHAEHDDLLDALEMGMELLGELCKPKVERLVHYEIPGAQR